MEKNYIKMPMDWVERIFSRLLEIYGERWTALYGNPKERNMYTTQWSTGLSGLTPNEIRFALNHCRSLPHSHVPSVVEFYHYAKGIRCISMPIPKKNSPVDHAIRKDFLNQAMAKIKTRNVLRET